MIKDISKNETVAADDTATAAGAEKPVFNQFEYQNNYVREKYDRVNLTMPKGKKAEIKAAAGQRGKSVNEFINAAIDTALKNGQQ
nr:MAG TPA: hypothetical protein [Bacteriophage sp.]